MSFNADLSFSARINNQGLYKFSSHVPEVSVSHRKCPVVLPFDEGRIMGELMSIVVLSIRPLLAESGCFR
ncbi:MAG: hypothetical protein AAFP20_18020, partial [Cyanobacteria bacterium J06614_10]